jgi:hypothetical protein
MKNTLWHLIMNTPVLFIYLSVVIKYVIYLVIYHKYKKLHILGLFVNDNPDHNGLYINLYWP